MDLTLNEKLVAIGIRLAGVKVPSGRKRDHVDVEATLLEAVGQVEQDGRMLSVLLSWIGVHG